MKLDDVKDEEILCESCNNYIVQKWTCYTTRLCVLTGKAVIDAFAEEANSVITCNKWRKKE